MNCEKIYINNFLSKIEKNIKFNELTFDMTGMRFPINEGLELFYGRLAYSFNWDELKGGEISISIYPKTDCDDYYIVERILSDLELIVNKFHIIKVDLYKGENASISELEFCKLINGVLKIKMIRYFSFKGFENKKLVINVSDLIHVVSLEIESATVSFNTNSLLNVETAILRCESWDDLMTILSCRRLEYAKLIYVGPQSVVKGKTKVYCEELILDINMTIREFLNSISFIGNKIICRNEEKRILRSIYEPWYDVRYSIKGYSNYSASHGIEARVDNGKITFSSSEYFHDLESKQRIAKDLNDSIENIMKSEKFRNQFSRRHLTIELDNFDFLYFLEYFTNNLLTSLPTYSDINGLSLQIMNGSYNPIPLLISQEINDSNIKKIEFSDNIRVTFDTANLEHIVSFSGCVQDQKSLNCIMKSPNIKEVKLHRFTSCPVEKNSTIKHLEIEDMYGDLELFTDSLLGLEKVKINVRGGLHKGYLSPAEIELIR